VEVETAAPSVTPSVAPPASGLSPSQKGGT